MYSKDELQRRRAALSSSKRALLARQLDTLGGDEGGSPPPTIPRRAPGATVPLAITQQHFWFLQQLDPSSTSYIHTNIHVIDYPFDPMVLTAALHALVERHEILRTVYTVCDGQVVQSVDSHFADALTVRVHDLQQLPEQDRAQAARKFIDQERKRPLSPLLGPPWSVQLIQLRADYQLLLLRVHHLLADGWSVDTLLPQELRTFFQAAVAGKPSKLPALPVQYADFACWQHERLHGYGAVQLAYWQAQLADAPWILDFPTDYPRPAVQAYREMTHPVRISAALTQRIKLLGQREQATPFMVLLAAFAVLLARFAEQPDLLLGTSLAGRPVPELEQLIGCFSSSLPVRIDMRDHPSFTALVRRTRERCIGMLAHQDLPIEQIVAALQPPRDLSRSLLYQAMFQMQNYPQLAHDQRLLDSETQIEARGQSPSGTGQGMVDLALLMYEGEEFVGELTYDATLFAPETIRRLMETFTTLITVALDTPDSPIDQLTLLRDADAQLLANWNATAMPQLHICIHILVEQQARLTPEGIAIQYQNQALTYEQLEQQANQLAHHLRVAGIRPERRVGVCVERSPEAVISLLAVLKAGGTYVPLDPHLPTERLRWMLADASIALLVTDARSRNLAQTLNMPLVDLDTDAPLLSTYPTCAPASESAPANLAYIMYTSGSTGTPKGVMVEHHALVNLNQAARAMYALSPQDRVLQFASLSFDACFEELFPCLTSGGTLVLRDDTMLDSVALFLARCRDAQISVLDLPTAYWHELAAHLWVTQQSLPPGIRLVIIGGERAMPERLAQWQQCVGNQVRLINTYGPTETTVIVSTAELTNCDANGRELPIGRPIANTQLYALDSKLRPVPIGMPGELYVGGAGLARGYAGRAALSAACFVPSPFANGQHLPTAGQRLYRTGDRVRWLPDGTLQFLGRVDRQIKLRGFRIELDEIEIALASHPVVQSVAALARADATSDLRLVAYVVPQHDQSQPELTKTLEAHVRARLPDYMVPSALVILDHMPYTPSGKLDYARLPEPQARPSIPYAAPTTPVEKELAAIWCVVLKHELIGIDDNFFALGGHSLLAGQIIYRINAAFQVELPLRRLFQEPTIVELALAIEEIWIEELEHAMEHEA